MFGSKKKSSKKPSSTSKVVTKGKTRTKKAKIKSVNKNSPEKKKAAPKKAAPKKTTTAKKAAAKKAAPKKTTTAKKAAAKKAAPKKTTTVKKAAPKKAAPKKTTTVKKAAPKKTTTVKKAAAKKASPKKTTTKVSKAVKSTTKKIINSIKEIVTLKPPFIAYNGLKPYLFCSYAHEDMSKVFKIIDKINQMGYRIWYDEGISPGIEWPEAIGNSLLKCDQYLVFMTPNAITSRNVRNEINLAYSKNKDLLVVYLEPTRLSGGMQLQLGTVQCVNKYELTNNQFFDIINKVLNSKIKN